LKVKKMDVRLTEEQKEIIKALKDLDKIKVNAYAGTGKTTTIRACAEEFKNKRILVLAFNRAIAKELKEKLPPNCEVRTIHGLARKLLGIDPDKIKDESDLVGELSDIFGENHSVVKVYVEAFKAYCNSEFTELNEENLIRLFRRNSDLRKQVLALFREEGKSPKEILYNGAEELAGRISYIFYAIRKGVLPITHDYYLKLFQLRFEDFSDFFKRYYLLAIDEAQDLNGVQEYLLKNAPVPKKLAVGDKHQQIYSWRLAINSLARLKDWEERYLTVSFRFQNEGIVALTNEFLKNWKGETKLLTAKRTGRKTWKTAIISRTNAMLIRELARINKKVCFTRDIEEIFRTIRQAQKLLLFFKHKDESFLDRLPYYLQKLALEFIETATTVEEFARLFEEVGEEEYARGIMLALEYDIEELYEKAKKLHDPKAKLVLTTAHSAKGLEFDKVVLTEDFKPLEMVVARKVIEVVKVNSEEKAREVVERIKSFDERFSEVIDEINLYYVAWTRALYEVDGEGAIVVANSFEKVFDGELLFKAIKTYSQAVPDDWGEED